MKNNDDPTYLSYLLRLWRENGDDRMGWRVSLESTDTGERLGFANLALMVEYLHQQIQSSHRQNGALNNGDTKFKI